MTKIDVPQSQIHDIFAAIAVGNTTSRPMKILLPFFATYLLLSSTVFAEPVKVYAASSMTNVLDELATIYEDKYSVKVVPVYGGSSSLARQIEYGAPADLYISANSRWTNYLVDKGIGESDNVTSIASNQLVVVSSINHSVDLDILKASSWLAALTNQRLAIGEPNSVPVGIYSKESLKAIGVWSEIRPLLAPVKNVRAALALAERGEVPLAIVYFTDAKRSKDVQVVADIPLNTHSEISYPAMLINSDVNSRAFFLFLSSDAAKKVFLKHGFK